jgi:hypothetical protein
MQAERVELCSSRLMGKGVASSWFIPLQTDDNVEDVLSAFAQFLLNGSKVEQYPIIQTCFETLLNSEHECMFVFMRRWEDKAVGILKSKRPLCTEREKHLMQTLGIKSRWNLPLWTWKESHPSLTESMEKQCRNMKGHCFGIWCYR